MSFQKCFTVPLLAFVLFSATVSGQQPAPASNPNPNRINLNVVVTPNSGAPVAGLQASDFTISDNKSARSIASFKAVSGPLAPVEVVIVIDAVNSNYTSISYQRAQIDKFLRANGGHLAHPTSLAISTDTDTQIQEQISVDGNSLSALLDNTTIGLREIRRNGGFYADDERLNLSLNALQKLATKEAARPGRKIILWISPGWPYLTNTEVILGAKDAQQIFARIVALSTLLRSGNITLYSISPSGATQTIEQQFYYEEFLKGVTKPSQAQRAHLSLQVLAIQSGGRALPPNNDIAGQIEACIAETQSYYELSFDPPPADHRDEYHKIDVKVSKRGLNARTYTGYYAEP